MIHICVRSTVDWRDEAAFLAQVPPAFRQRVDLWNETFTLPFHVFRAEVKDIAARTLAAVEGAAVTAWNDVPEGALVIPIDDDDWLAPDVAAAVRAAHDPHAAGYHWISTNLEVPMHLRYRLALLRRRLLPATRPIWTCATNSYALVKRTDNEPLFVRHTLASRWFEGEGAALVRFIGRRLSVQNRTLASQTSLAWRRRTMTRAQLLRKFRAYSTLYSRPLHPELAWCRPYQTLMAGLMQELRLRR